MVTLKSLSKCHLGNTQLKVHLSRLAEMEYLLVHRRGNTFLYELLYDGESDATTHMNGLIDTQTLKKQTYDAKRSGQSNQQSVSGRPPVGGQSGGGRSARNAVKPSIAPSLDEEENNIDENAVFPSAHNNGSYCHDSSMMMSKGS